MSLIRNAYFDLALASAALLRVGQQGGSSSLLYPAKTGTVGFPPIIYFFNKVSLNTLDIFFCWILSQVRSVKSLEGSAPTLRFIFSFDVSDVFGGGSEVVRKCSQ